MKVDVVYNKSSQRMVELPDECIDTILTSPPYFGLRDYGDDVKETWGDPDCKHKWAETIPPKSHKSGKHGPNSSIGAKIGQNGARRGSGSNFCQKCGAWYGQLGLEPTFELYLEHMVIVCSEIKRVLKKTGSFWLNMGDTYGGASSLRTQGGAGFKPGRLGTPMRGISKCLLGIPSRLRNRLVDEQGWICRNTIIWWKPNAMPSSKKDALTPSYEFVFHFIKNIKPQYYWNEKTVLMADRKPKELKEGIDWEWRKCPKCNGIGQIEANDRKTKIPEKQAENYGSPRARYHRTNRNQICSRCKGTGKIKHSFWHSLGYWYDLDAIRERSKTGNDRIDRYDTSVKWGQGTQAGRKREAELKGIIEVRNNPAGKNPGDVWIIPTQPRPEAHFATFPDKLCIKPILATCPLEICKKCGKARVRVTRHSSVETRPGRKTKFDKRSETLKKRTVGQDQTIGWTDCGCGAGFEPGVVEDPFAGRGTVLIMAKKLGRHYVGHELKKEYCEKLIKPVLEEIDPLFQRRKTNAVSSEIPCLVHGQG